MTVNVTYQSGPLTPELAKVALDNELYALDGTIQFDLLDARRGETKKRHIAMAVIDEACVGVALAVSGKLSVYVTTATRGQGIGSELIRLVRIAHDIPPVLFTAYRGVDEEQSIRFWRRNKVLMGHTLRPTMAEHESFGNSATAYWLWETERRAKLWKELNESSGVPMCPLTSLARNAHAKET